MDGNSKTSIIVALIAATQAIAIAGIAAGWNLFGLIERGEDPDKTVAELQVTTDVFPLAARSADNCVEALGDALTARDFQGSGGNDEVAILRRGPYKAAIWCRPSEIVATVAGRRGSDTVEVMTMIKDAAVEAGLISSRTNLR